MAQYKILQEGSTNIYPITHPDAVRDENGKKISELYAPIAHDIVSEDCSLEDDQKATARANIGGQATLVSGTNIKTINGNSILGSGNISIEGGTSTPSGHPCHSLFVDDGAVWNSTTQKWELNGLTDITNEQMVAIHNAGRFGFMTPFFYAGLNIRTNLPMKGIYNTTQGTFGNLSLTGSGSYTFDVLAQESAIEVFAFGVNDDSAILNARFGSWSYAAAFGGCTNLRKIQGIMPINVAAANRLSGTFTGCTALTTAKLYGVKTNLDLSYSPNFDNASILYLIQNALNGTTNITIKLHADAWERADADTSIQSALTTNGHITLSK